MSAVRTRTFAIAVCAAAVLGAPMVQAAGAKKCGRVCVYAQPDFKGKRVCYSNPIRTPNLQRAWGKGFVPGSIKVTRHGRCSPVAYFFTETGYRGVVAAYFGTAPDIARRKYRSFHLKHAELDD
ncbi:MAG: hypothetical protein P8Z76_10120 [Alphaproteobacteria bacterium]